MRHKQSEYMHWAKTQSRARFNLATSGVGAFPLGELGGLPPLEINGDNSYGYAPLKQAIAGRYAVDADCVVTAAGTSGANYLAFATLLDAGDEVLVEHPAYGLLVDALEYVGAVVKRFARTPEGGYAVDADCVVTAAGTSGANYLAFATLLDAGDEVLIEHPAYGLLVDALEYVGAVVKRFARTFEGGYAVDPEVVRRAVTPGTKLIVVTNLHNPSSVLTGEDVLREIGEIARGVGARVLVDEVYLDAVYENTPRTAFHLGAEFVVTSSLTKVYGVSGLRCGWILAEAELARAMWRMNDVFAATPVHPGELLSVAVFGQLD